MMLFHKRIDLSFRKFRQHVRSCPIVKFLANRVDIRIRDHAIVGEVDRRIISADFVRS